MLSLLEKTTRDASGSRDFVPAKSAGSFHDRAAASTALAPCSATNTTLSPSLLAKGKYPMVVWVGIGAGSLV